MPSCILDKIDQFSYLFFCDGNQIRIKDEDLHKINDSNPNVEDSIDSDWNQCEIEKKPTSKPTTNPTTIAKKNPTENTPTGDNSKNQSLVLCLLCICFVLCLLSMLSINYY